MSKFIISVFLFSEPHNAGIVMSSFFLSPSFPNSIEHIPLTHNGGVYKYGLHTYYTFEEFLAHFKSRPELTTSNSKSWVRINQQK